jgi:hypothetical protein
MIRSWHSAPPPLRYRYGGPSWVDWVMPWVLMVVAALAFFYTAPLWMPAEVPAATDFAPTSEPIPQGHPTLDRAWKHSPPAPPSRDEGVPCFLSPAGC